MMNQSDRGGKRDQEGRARRPLLEREDQPADRGNVVIGGRGEAALRGRAGRAPRPHELRGRRGRGARARRLGEFQRRFRRFARRLLGGLAASAAPRVLRLDDRPSRFRCSALSRSARDVRFGSSRPRSSAFAGLFLSEPGHRIERVFRFPWPPLPRFQTSLALAPSRVPRNRRKLMREFARLATRYPPAAARSVIAKRPRFPDIKTTRKGPRRISPSPVIVNEFLGLKKV